MGKLYYGGTPEPIDVPDRLLAHIKVVTATKLRRGESFTLSWKHADGDRGRSTLWVHPSIALRFVFATADAELLDSDLLTSLANAASSTTGMTVDLLADAGNTATAAAAASPASV